MRADILGVAADVGYYEPPAYGLAGDYGFPGSFGQYRGQGANVGEIEYCALTYADLCPTFKLIADHADSEANQRFGQAVDGSAQNAFKHAYWSGLLTVLFDEQTAYNVTSAHELAAADQRIRNWGMDMLNNQIGAEVGVSQSTLYRSTVQSALSTSIGDELQRPYLLDVVGEPLADRVENLVRSGNACFIVPSDGIGSICGF